MHSNKKLFMSIHKNFIFKTFSFSNFLCSIIQSGDNSKTHSFLSIWVYFPFFLHSFMVANKRNKIKKTNEISIKNVKSKFTIKWTTKFLTRNFFLRKTQCLIKIFTKTFFFRRLWWFHCLQNRKSINHKSKDN